MGMFVLEDMIGLAPDSVDFVASLWLLSFALGDVSNWVTARNPHFLKKKKANKSTILRATSCVLWKGKNSIGCSHWGREMCIYLGKRNFKMFNA